MRTMTPQPPAPLIDRELVQQLSKAAALADRALSGPPAIEARGVNYQERQWAIERDARRELKALLNTLAAMELD